MGIRIWYQSSVAIGQNPVFKPYEEAIARNMRTVARPHTTVDIHGVERMTAHYERSRYARYVNGISIVRNAARAEAEGYDAVAVGCYTDPCLEEVRDTVTIPTLFIMQTSMHVAPDGSGLTPRSVASLRHNPDEQNPEVEYPT